MKSRRRNSILHLITITPFAGMLAVTMILALAKPRLSFAANGLYPLRYQAPGECYNVIGTEYLDCAKRGMPYPECVRFLRCSLMCPLKTGDIIFTDEEVLACVQENGGEGLVLPSSPEPNPDPNPEPSLEPNPGSTLEPNLNPNPGPNPYMDPEVLQTLQGILGTPIVPVTGAVAGGVVAWIISMLGGSRTVLPVSPRLPKGGFRPGQVGPDGRVWSSQGWISKATYDYQQKWIQKGWRLNPQTGKLEVQPGAMNDKGQVWYKLPYDEGNSHYWVDQAKVQECERNLAEGYVYDHGQGGWIKKEDLADYERGRADWRQKDHAYSVERNQKIQQEVRGAQAQRAEERRQQEITERRGEIESDMEMYQRRAGHQVERADMLGTWSNRLGWAETGADVFISVASKFTGPVGKSVEFAYNTVKRTALSVDTAIDKGSVVEGIKDYGKRYVTDKAIEQVSSAVSVDTISSEPGKMFKTFVAGTGKPGIKAFSKTGLRAVKGAGAVVDYGKGKLLEAGADEYGDGLGQYLGQVVQTGPGGWMPK